MRADKRASHKAEKKPSAARHRQGVVGYSKKSALLEEAITHMNAGKYGRSSAALKDLLAIDPQNAEARRLFATLHLRLGSLVTARQAFESLATEAIGRQDYWLAESLLREYLAAGPRCIPFLELLAHVYEEKGDSMAAVAELGKAIEILLEDPDPENPRKPAQLYAKIRDLAPASPTAFQFASSFDIQTGEFRITDRPNSEGTPPAEYETDRSSAIPDSRTEPPDIMPWEQLDESQELASGPQDSGCPTSVQPVLDHALEQTTLTADLATGHGDGTAPTAVHDSAEPGLVEEEIAAPQDTACSQEQGTVDSAGSPLYETAEQPGSLLSRMPWEHVADPSLQIMEPEPTPLPEPEPASSEAPSLSPLPAPTECAANEAADAPAASTLEASPSPVPPSEQPAFSQDLVEPVAVQDMPDDQIAEVPPPSAPSTPDPIQAASETGSFSWKEIFDSAWKFTIGTTAPGPSVPTKPAQEPAFLTGEVSQPIAAPGHDLSPMKPPVLPADPESEFRLRPEPAPVIEEPAWPSHEAAVAPALASMTPEACASIPEAKDPSGPPVVNQPQLEPGEPLAPVSLTEPALAVADPATESPAVSEAEQGVEAEPIVVPPVANPAGPPAHWDTGEVRIQSSPSKAAPEPQAEPVSEPTNRWEPALEETQPVAAAEPAYVPVDTRPEWEKASAWIQLETQAAPAAPTWQASAADSATTAETTISSPAESAVEVLFGSGHERETARTSDHLSRPRSRRRLAVTFARLRVFITSIILSGFTTTRAFVVMCVTLTALGTLIAVLTLGIMAVTWVAMEEPATPHYQNLTVGPQRTMADSKKNGFLLLMGFSAPAGLDPVQTGYERKPSDGDLSAARLCMDGRDAKGAAGTGASSNVVDGWFRGTDPAGQVKDQSETVKSLVARETSTISRYQQWLTMPFEDWGFGKIMSPDCPRILLAHRLYLLEGFHQDTASGVGRLEKDMEAWRSVLGQSKTLMVKMLAVTAVQDDVTVASGLLTRHDTDAAAVNRLAKLVRPLDQVELSVRWPMQSYFAWATGQVASELRKDRTDERPWYVSMAAAMPLPVQRRANAYAEYYEAANRAVAEGRYVSLPKAGQFVRTSASNLFDYVVNPLEHIIGIEALPAWDPYVGRMVAVDAQMRLASLQAWVRRGPQEGDVLNRLAKAGQAYYDPFTGLPMLVNQQKRILYSVGPDGKDQEGDARLDIAVAIPTVSPSVETKKTK